MYLELRRLASIWPYWTQSAIAQLVLPAITSQCDCCKSILAGLPFKQISKKPHCKHILRKAKYDHVTPLLQELRWLLIKFWPQYKIATFVYWFFNGSLLVISPGPSVHINLHKTFIHCVRISSKSQSIKHENFLRALLQISCTFCRELSDLQSQKVFYSSAFQIQTQNSLVYERDERESSW